MNEYLLSWREFVLHHQRLIGGLLAVWVGFAGMELAQDFYRAGVSSVDGALRHLGQALYIFLPWVIFSVGCGRYCQRRPFLPDFNGNHLARHIVLAVAIAWLHLSLIASSFWLFWPHALRHVSFSDVLVEQGLRWFHFELLVYFATALLWHWRLHRTSRPTTSPEAMELVVREAELTHRVVGSEIVWLQADDNYIIVHCEERSLRLRKPLKNVAADLGEQHFVQTHRSAIVNLEWVASVELARVVMRNGDKAPLSRRRRRDLMNRLHRKASR